jgi:hypothetical protein
MEPKVEERTGVILTDDLMIYEVCRICVLVTDVPLLLVRAVHNAAVGVLGLER